MLDTILFDLDGTLLPMRQEDFIKAYITQLCRRYIPCGYDKENIVKALWTATMAMVKNDGTRSNETCFWDSFNLRLGDTELIRSTLPSFYTREFDDIREIITPTNLPRLIIDTLQSKGYTLVLATNPLFPPVGVATRLSWIGLLPTDFCRVTTYSNSTFCKPSLGYYEEILRIIGKTPAQCCMVGNNPGEDLVAGDLGLSVYLVTDFLENAQALPTEGYPQGSLESVLAWARRLPSLR